MSVQSLSSHPEHFPEGFAGIAFIGALLGSALSRAWIAHHPHPAHAARPTRLHNAASGARHRG